MMFVFHFVFNSFTDRLLSPLSDCDSSEEKKKKTINRDGAFSLEIRSMPDHVKISFSMFSKLKNE